MIVVDPVVKLLASMGAVSVHNHHDGSVRWLVVDMLPQLPQKTSKSCLIRGLVNVINKTASALYWGGSDSCEPRQVGTLGTVNLDLDRL